MGGSRVHPTTRCVTERNMSDRESKTSLLAVAGGRRLLQVQVREELPFPYPCDTDSERSQLSDCPTSAAEDDMRIRGRSGKKKVSFSIIQIRTYKVEVGDHPCCSIGFPLALGWEYSEKPTTSLDQYEAERAPRRHRNELRTTSEERQEMLREEGLSKEEMKRAQRKLHRARSCSAKLSERMCESFFGEGNKCPSS